MVQGSTLLVLVGFAMLSSAGVFAYQREFARARDEDGVPVAIQIMPREGEGDREHKQGRAR